jgi:hypothetical protein
MSDKSFDSDLVPRHPLGLVDCRLDCGQVGSGFGTTDVTGAGTSQISRRAVVSQPGVRRRDLL